MDEYSGYLTSFSVQPYPCGGEDTAPIPCAAAAAAASSEPHVHVRLSHHIADDWIDDSDEEEECYEIESRTICLSNDLLAEKSGDDSRSFIFFEGLRDWPIDAVTVLEIADEVIEKVRRLRCDLQVDIRSVQ